eukprot:2826269-Alexandrium_andersonii.AAC.1
MAALSGRADIRYVHVGPRDQRARGTFAHAGGFSHHPPPGWHVWHLRDERPLPHVAPCTPGAPPRSACRRPPPSRSSREVRSSAAT